MRILHVIPFVSPLYGGPSQAIRDMAASLARQGHEVDVATTTADGAGELPVPTGRAQVEDGARFIYFPRQRPKSWTFSWPLSRWLLEQAGSYDLLHVHYCFAYPSLAGCAAARRAGRPYVLRPVGTLDPWSLAQKAWKKVPYLALVERRNLRFAAAIQASSRREAANLARLGPDGRNLAGKTRIIPEIIRPAPAPPRRLPAGGGPLRLLFLGRLHPAKSFPVLLKAVASLEKGGLRCTLTVAGEGEPGYRRRLEELAGSLGLQEITRFVGFAGEKAKAQYLAEADLLVLPSQQENFGIAAAEAMAAGLPVVVSDQVALAEEIAAAGAGLVAPVGKVEELAGAIRRLAEPGIRAEMGQKGRRLTAERFDPERVGRQLSDLYHDVLANWPHDKRW